MCKTALFVRYLLKKVQFCALLGALSGIGGNRTIGAESYCAGPNLCGTESQNREAPFQNCRPGSARISTARTTRVSRIAVKYVIAENGFRIAHLNRNLLSPREDNTENVELKTISTTPTPHVSKQMSQKYAVQ